jgi:hypothetical protein
MVSDLNSPWNNLMERFRQIQSDIIDEGNNAANNAIDRLGTSLRIGFVPGFKDSRTCYSCKQWKRELLTIAICDVDASGAAAGNSVVSRLEIALETQANLLSDALERHLESLESKFR